MIDRRNWGIAAELYTFDTSTVSLTKVGTPPSHPR